MNRKVHQPEAGMSGRERRGVDPVSGSDPSQSESYDVDLAAPGQRSRPGLVSFHIPIVPVGKQRARFSGPGRRPHTPERTRRAEEDIAILSRRAAPRDPITGGVGMRIWFWLDVPRSWSKKKRAAALDGAVVPTGKPDLDNLTKTVLDGINGSAAWWGDDAQVVELDAKKRYGEKPGISIEIWPVGGA